MKVKVILKFFLLILFVGLSTSISLLSSYQAGFLNLKSTKPAFYLIEKVVDGDTIILSDGRLVRYLGIDTPEIRKKEKGIWVDVSEPYAVEALSLNIKLLRGKKIRLEYDREKKDHYQRDLCYVFADNIFVNEILLKEGLAFPYLTIKNLKYYERLKSAFLEAKSQKKNLFKINLSTEKDLNKFIGQYVFFEGKVKNIISRNQTEIFFDRLIVSINNKVKSLNAGDYVYVYGKLIKKKERFIIRADKNKLFKLY